MAKCLYILSFSYPNGYNVEFLANNVQIWDVMWLLPLPAYYVLTFRTAALIATKFQLSPASAAIVLLEQVSIYTRESLLLLPSFKKPNEDFYVAGFR